MSTNGEKIVKETGFQYRYPKFDISNLDEAIRELIEQKLWPPVYQ
jgi:hypothetical protein